MKRQTRIFILVMGAVFLVAGSVSVGTPTGAIIESSNASSISNTILFLVGLVLLGVGTLNSETTPNDLEDRVMEYDALREGERKPNLLGAQAYRALRTFEIGVGRHLGNKTDSPAHSQFDTPTQGSHTTFKEYVDNVLKDISGNYRQKDNKENTRELLHHDEAYLYQVDFFEGEALENALGNESAKEFRETVFHLQNAAQFLDKMADAELNQVPGDHSESPIRKMEKFLQGYGNEVHSALDKYHHFIDLQTGGPGHGGRGAVQRRLKNSPSRTELSAALARLSYRDASNSDSDNIVLEFMEKIANQLRHTAARPFRIRYEGNDRRYVIDDYAGPISQLGNNERAKQIAEAAKTASKRSTQAKQSYPLFDTCMRTYQTILDGMQQTIIRDLYDKR